MILSSLHIKNFRMLEDFKVSKLGRVNLIVGKNNSGKSTVLEAIRIFSGNANTSLLAEIASDHDEPTLPSERGSPSELFPFASFFTGRRFSDDNEKSILISEIDNPLKSLQLEPVYLIKREQPGTTKAKSIEASRISWELIEKEKLPTVKESTFRGLKVLKNNQHTFHFVFDDKVTVVNSTFEGQKPIPCSFSPTKFVSLDDLADEWDKIAVTGYSKNLKEALQFIDKDFENVIFVKNNMKHSERSYMFAEIFSRPLPVSRLAIIQMANVDQPVPLNSMGEGMLRILQLALKVPGGQKGLLLIDEFENGLHYSIQEQVWGWLFKLAKKLDIQVFATTHSYDCVENFAKVAKQQEDKDCEGILFRVSRSVRASDKNKVIATVYEAEKLATITKEDIEIR